jgi:Protein of unknown function (DUF4019)
MTWRFFLRGFITGTAIVLGLGIYKRRKREMLKRESIAAQLGPVVGSVDGDGKKVTLFEIVDGPVKKAVISDSQNWLALIDGGDFQGSWDNLSQLCKSFVPWEDYRWVTANFRSKHGGVYERVLKRVWYTSEWLHSPDGDYVGVEYESKMRFDKDRVKEFTVLVYEDGKWRVVAHQFAEISGNRSSDG